MKNKKTNKSLKLALAGALTLLMSNASATLISGVGAFASVGAFNYCPSYCTGDYSGNSNGGEGITEAYAEVTDYGYGQAYSSFVDGSYLPLLRVETSAGLRKEAGATAFSVQNYTNTGLSTKTIDLNINLHGSVASNTGDADNRLSANIAILGGTALEWYPRFGTLLSEVAAHLPRIDLANLSISDGLDVNEFTTISFDIAAGESFYIVSEIRATSKNGYADAWNTLSMSFQNGSNLQAAIQTTSPTNPTSVPEPETLFLFALGLTGVALRSRKA